MANQFARDQGRRLIALDDFAFVAKTSVRKPLAVYEEEIRQTIGGDRCAIEGCYSDLIAALAQAGDHLLWLDLPVAVCLERAKSRGWEPSKWPSKELQDWFLPNLISFIEGYASDTSPTGRSAHQALFDSFPGTVERVS